MTYSIVARDGQTGELGVAVQSHYFQVGPVVPWALAGVGAIATQSLVNVGFGPMGLELLRGGCSPEQAVKALLAGDAHPEVRQLAIVDAGGRAAAHTGAKCIPAAGHVTGDGFSAQANLMERDTVWAAMAEAFTATSGPLPERLMAALDAAEAEGGDIRGRQSAAMLVVSGRPAGRYWEDRTVDLRVEDSPEPLAELRRLLNIRRAYQTDDVAERLELEGDLLGSLKEREQGVAIAPEMEELAFWAGLQMAMTGELDRGLPFIQRAVAKEPRWTETLRRLVAVGRVAPEVAQAIAARLNP